MRGNEESGIIRGVAVVLIGAACLAGGSGILVAWTNQTAIADLKEDVASEEEKVEKTRAEIVTIRERLATIEGDVGHINSKVENVQNLLEAVADRVGAPRPPSPSSP